ncbi:MAG: DUF2384 domain-containing protein [Chloroflexota bacterium]|nr:DUF2384 domain-containing protein [Chloroflexota bacterium]
MSEIGSLATMFGYSDLERLVGTSEASLRRYAAASRETPDVVARRLHFLATLVAILRGSFNEFGVRRWFERPHPALRDRPPNDLLSTTFDPDGEEARAIVAAAANLLW